MYDYERFRAIDNAFRRRDQRASGKRDRVDDRPGHPPPDGGADAAACCDTGVEDCTKRTIAEHRGILEALAARDGALAAERISAHIEFEGGRSAKFVATCREHLTPDDHPPCGSRQSTLT